MIPAVRGHAGSGALHRMLARPGASSEARDRVTGNYDGPPVGLPCAMRCLWPASMPLARALPGADRTTARRRLSLTKLICEVGTVTTQVATADAGAVTAGFVIRARRGRPATMASRGDTR
jgi:hypothetical protein